MSEFLQPIRKQARKNLNNSIAKFNCKVEEKLYNTKRRAEAVFNKPGVVRKLVGGYVYKGKFYSTVSVYASTPKAISQDISEVRDLKIFQGI